MRRLAIAASLLALSACASATPADREDWAADFEQLVDHVAAVYANLEWAVDERNLDLAELTTRTREQLARAGSLRAARRAIDDFVRGFDDPHFHVKRGDHRNHGGGSEPAPGLAPDVGASAALKAMGFKRRNLDFRIDFDSLPGYERVRPSDDNPFAWGAFDAGDRRIGLLRIAHFGEDGYPDVAEPLWPSFAGELEEPCDLWCQWRFREGVMDALLDDLVAGARALKASGIDAMLIDITGNGGGTDWAAVAPRIFAPPLTRRPPIGVVRHPHHADRLEGRVASVTSMMDEPALSAESRRILGQARDTVARQHREALEPCDHRSLLDGTGSAPECTQLTFGSGCGLVEYLPPDSLLGVEQRASIFRPLGSDFEEGIWDGPLYVLTDGDTASASEHFLALLEANDAATFLGEPTLGAGCGFIGGGVPAYLPHLDLTVRMPDCARYRANGRNEIEGIEPDIPVRLRARDIHAVLSAPPDVTTTER